MNEELIRVENLKVIYKTTDEIVQAVNGISFTLNKGETIGLVGETGAGKTTTALGIMRLLPERTGKIISGSITFEGNNLLELSDEEMRLKIRGEKIAMIFQDPMTALNPVMTVGEQIAEAIRYHSEKINESEIGKRVDEVLELVGISSSRKHEYPHQFSGGMKQRVVIAIALSCEPDLLIADEPTTALDVTIQAQVLAMMGDLRDRLKTAMILITHDLGVVAQICDKVAVMYAGELIEVGMLEDIFVSKEHHPYTIGLFGAIPNLEEDSDRLSPIVGLMPDPAKLPRGCNFQDRCPYCMDVCKENNPKVYVNGTHNIACHLFSEKQLWKGDNYE
ncbi:MAG: ABC transporter ATP-binding protein [Sedimentibacter sp.]|uniref:ABC transporter ATP-binding protein n=1 Tax=Sedimentibacter sp. TaxID=1960295 RepID=UPI002981AF15|nr:ABC transporter ATP-binding protein [Sedimentibacter sp.]MDW5299571.1 ABC transporter ATP-binding protein [Sedimentibacter sp.]